MQALAFYGFAGITLGAAIAAVSVRHPVHAVLSLICAFLGASGLFILLNAEFLAMLMLIVYVGAVAVFFLFVVMMLELPKSGAHTPAVSKCARVCAGIGALVLPLMVGWAVVGRQTIASPARLSHPMPDTAVMSNTRALAAYLYTDYGYALLVSGFVLLVAMIGAIVLSLRPPADTKRQNTAAQLARTKENALDVAPAGKGEGVEC